MTNFDFLKTDSQFATFADTAAQAELVLPISPAFCATGSRTALEFAVKWLYSVDSSLIKPYDDKLVALINAEDFKDLLPARLMPKIDYIRKLGNNATHCPSGITTDQAWLALENLHSFMSFVAYCYGTDYEETAFDRNIKIEPKPVEPVVAVVLDELIKENEPKKDELTKKRKTRLKAGYTVKPMDFTEDQTRKAYVDVMLADAGWVRGNGWVDEYRIDEMPNKSGFGFADYVLFGDDGLPLAVIEAKKTSKDPKIGRRQAELYANFLEKKFGRRPIIFLTNGYETRIWSEHYPERQISGIFSKRDLQKEFNKLKSRKPLKGVDIKDKITNRYYQKAAIQAVCDTIDEKNRRKALLVMATGSGKTRTVISLVDVLERYGWVKNVLFLADRQALVTQAKRAFAKEMPDLSLCNLLEDKTAASARVVFSTYQTMMNCIDDTRDDGDNRLFTPGHFDLIIVDEAHRSIYNKYKNIFTYFDAILVGLTATPKDFPDKDTYAIFDLEAGVPTYGFELAEAVPEYLVDFVSIETELKFMTEGIKYDELTIDEKEQYENTFADEEGDIPDAIEASALNEWLFNHDTIKKALHQLMTKGQKVDSGTKIGKTIIFAKNKRHAEKILEVWGAEYPDYPQGYCQAIYHDINYAQSLIDDFSDKDKFPQIVVSVDMMDTGIDVPEILNLVFFKKVFSRAKFWQMIGRGTRLCEGLIDGKDKELFYIFDLCGNFNFFRMDSKGKEVGAVVSLQERVFNIKTEMVYKLQEATHQIDELKEYRVELVRDLVAKISLLNRDKFDVKQHLRTIDKFQKEADFATLEYKHTLEIAEHIAPLIPPSQDEIFAVRFDMLIYQIELAMLMAKGYKRAKNDLISKVMALSKITTIPDIARQSELISQILHDGFLDKASVADYEKIRTCLRDLIKFIPADEREHYNTNFIDDFLSEEWNESQLDNDDLANYRKKVNHYISENENIPAIAKLKGNIPLTPSDVQELERILWNELGTKEQYEAQFPKTPLGELVRSIVGLSRQAVNDAFSDFLSSAALDSRQMHFVKQIVRYIEANGMMKDLTILQDSTFTNIGRVSELFDDESFAKLRKTIDAINANAAA